MCVVVMSIRHLLTVRVHIQTLSSWFDMVETVTFEDPAKQAAFIALDIAKVSRPCFCSFFRFTHSYRYVSPCLYIVCTDAQVRAEVDSLQNSLPSPKTEHGQYANIHFVYLSLIRKHAQLSRNVSYTTVLRITTVPRMVHCCAMILVVCSSCVLTDCKTCVCARAHCT
jgi:hypothetical protein